VEVPSMGSSKGMNLFKLLDVVEVMPNGDMFVSDLQQLQARSSFFTYEK
jgi:hypothetical protein